MQRLSYILFFICILFNISLKGQCDVVINNSSIQHIVCPDGGAVGGASILQSNFTNYWWTNITTGQQNSNFGPGVTSVNNLNAGFYIITAAGPFNASCPSLVYSDTFEIIEASPVFQFSPNQSCPDICNVIISTDMDVAIPGVNYSMYFDSFFFPIMPFSIQNQCGGTHTYSINADGVSCGTEVIGVSQFAPMNLQTSVVDQNCNQPGSADVVITGVGASGLSTYCTSFPQMTDYSIIENVVLNGDNTSINNNTSGICNTYVDFTNLSSDVSPGGTYSITIDLGTCSNQGTAWIDLANIFVDWNIDGDFDDASELVGQISPTQSPSSHVITLNVPIGAIPGQSRMRIVSQNFQYQPTNQAGACDDNVAYFGETEDYTIVVNGSFATPISYLWSDGQTDSTATNLTAGTYYVTVTDANGCTATDTVIVGGNLGLATVIASTDQTVCDGGTPNAISATANSSGSYTWIPNDFVNPDISNPVFASGISFSTTMYYVTFTDNMGCVATDSVLITVNPVPTVTLTAAPNPACIGDNIFLSTTTSIPVNEYRFQYNLSGSWIDISGGTGWVNSSSVTYNNISQSTQFRVKVKEYNGCNSSSWSPAITVPIVTFGSLPIWHN